MGFLYLHKYEQTGSHSSPSQDSQILAWRTIYCASADFVHGGSHKPAVYVYKCKKIGRNRAGLPPCSCCACLGKNFTLFYETLLEQLTLLRSDYTAARLAPDTLMAHFAKLFNDMV
jgi:hypothetical protein